MLWILSKGIKNDFTKSFRYFANGCKCWFCALSVDNKTNEKIKSVDLIINANSNKIVFSNGETKKEVK